MLFFQSWILNTLASYSIAHNFTAECDSSASLSKSMSKTYVRSNIMSSTITSTIFFLMSNTIVNLLSKNENKKCVLIEFLNTNLEEEILIINQMKTFVHNPLCMMLTAYVIFNIIVKKTPQYHSTLVEVLRFAFIYFLLLQSMQNQRCRLLTC